MSTETRIDFFYLTPTGWLEGTEPPGCVESWRRTISEDHRVSWRCEWVDLQRTKAERDTLREKFQAVLAPAAIARTSDSDGRSISF
jgi:hypothetical protein